MTTLGDFSSGDVLTAADLNSIATWTSFTPTWTNLTVGNGTYDWSLYSKVNDIVFFSMRFTLGSTSSVGTTPEFTVPVATSNNTQLSVGTGRIGQGGNFYFAWPYMVSNEIQVWLFGTSSTYATRTAVTSAAPGSWATGHSIQIQGSYYV